MACGAYSIELAKKFGWASITANLHPERVAHLNKYLVGKKILDAGCGGGAYVSFLAGKGFDVVGVERESAFLAYARQNMPREKFVQADVERLPFRDREFDATFCYDVLEHVSDDQLVLRELARVTRKRLILAVPKENDFLARFGLAFATYTDLTHVRYYTEATLKDLVDRIGARKLKIEPELSIDFRSLTQDVFIFNSFGRFGNKLFQRALKILLSLSSPKQIFSGLVAIADL